MFNVIEVDFSISLTAACSLPVPLSLMQLTCLFRPSGFSTDEFMHLFSGCFNVPCLFGGLAAQPALPLFLLSCYTDFVPTA